MTVVMCGIIGLVTGQGGSISLEERAFVRMRDRLAHRGPDGAGLFRDEQVFFGHRRLAILDPDHGDQPLVIRDDRGNVRLVLTYNGEIYNHLELRHALERAGHRFRTQCDSETLAVALDEWGSAALDRLRGMYAFAAWWPQEQSLLIARDPLGVKPLYYGTADTANGPELVFASEPLAILDHPAWKTQPDWATVSAYLTTIRVTLGHRTMYAGLNTLLPGEIMEYDCSGAAPRMSHQSFHRPANETLDADPIHQAREIISDSVRYHLLSDQPVASLLSGGLDSTIIAAVARDEVSDLQTWCVSGTPTPPNGDFDCAALAAEALGTKHTGMTIDRKAFAERWPWMISRLGVPLGTPNEVAIHAVTEALGRSARVALSGEGADELFAGYGLPLSLAEDWITASRTGATDLPAACFYLDLVSWINPAHKPEVLQPEVYAAAEDDIPLVTTISDTFDSCGDPFDLATHRRVQQSLNLTGLLGRLDTATMLASVEGRTPFADVRVAGLAASLPLEMNYGPGGTGSGGTATATAPRTKDVLRRAFASSLPASIVSREKASFPLPFQEWMADQAPDLLCRGVITDVVRPEVRRAVAEDPTGQWQLAWPLFNLAHWLRAVFE